MVSIESLMSIRSWYGVCRVRSVTRKGRLSAVLVTVSVVRGGTSSR